MNEPSAPKVAPFGSWLSPITAERLGGDAVRLSGCASDGDDRYWLEGRASEGGRSVLARCDGGGARVDITPAPFNVRSRVHEYGGNPYVVADQTVWFVNFKDQQIYTVHGTGTPSVLTACPTERFVDMHYDATRRRLICIGESHHDGAKEPKNYIASVDIDTGEVQPLCEGADFYASPCVSPDGRQLAWLSWDHPNMPWDETTLWLAHIDSEGRVTQPRRVAGGNEVSVFQPHWSPSGVLHFISDESGWWNIYRSDDDAYRIVCQMERDFGRGQWQFGMRTFGFVSAEQLVVSYVEGGEWRLATLSASDGQMTPVQTPYTDFDGIEVQAGSVLCTAGSAQVPTSVVEIDLAQARTEVHRVSNDIEFARGFLSDPEAVTYATSNGDQAHGFYYAPCNADFCGPQDERPPLLVLGHGGPTSATSTSLSLAVQYWTSRGFAVLDVNYRGSTGYGRHYRNLLRGQWGVYDVDDCVHGALALADRGLADRNRLAIRGGSAGGYTALAALTFHDVFAAGASYYGISELEVLAKETHKFESRYLDSLIGPYPERKDLYEARSPINFTEQLTCPIIFFQGLRDEVVPPNQAEMMVAALRNKGVPVAHLTFPDEGHGFRAASTIKQTLESELVFYGRIFGFQPAGSLVALEIDGL
ncbi:MAG: S9 family peptidase [Gammaproteobacteria bacterium]|nr:S9 family peptidase [Gammaproteobacteria bacterium]